MSNFESNSYMYSKINHFVCCIDISDLFSVRLIETRCFNYYAANTSLTKTGDFKNKSLDQNPEKETNREQMDAMEIWVVER